MINLKEINKKRKEILLDLNPDEVLLLFKEINKKVVESLGNYENGFKWNIEDINKANDELNDLEIILSEKYPNIHGLTASTRLEAVVKKYIESEDEIKALIFNIHFERFLGYTKTLETNISYLEGVLIKYYMKYKFRANDLERMLIDELNVPEDIVLDTLEPYIYYNNKFYSNSLENMFNSFIKALVENIEYDIDNLKPLLAVDLEPTNYNTEHITKIVEGIVQIKILADSLIKRYYDVLSNPFGKAINIEAEVKNELFNKLLKEHDPNYEGKTIEEEKEIILPKAPSYNFDTFELIVPDLDSGLLN